MVFDVYILNIFSEWKEDFARKADKLVLNVDVLNLKRQSDVSLIFASL